VNPLRHDVVQVGGLRLHVAEQGDGPLVLLLHGFPECWYSWRHQFAPLASAGYRVVAPDQRGYARSDRPEAVGDYSIMHLAGDVIGLVHALGHDEAVLVGHDWGAPIAWATAQMRPDVVRGVAGLSVPPIPRGERSPLTTRRAVLGEAFYQVYFQAPGRADTEFAADVRRTFRTLLYSASGDSPATLPPRPWEVGDEGTLLDTMIDPRELPPWLSEEDIDVFVREYTAHGGNGFTGGLNYYRNMDRNWALTAAFARAGLPMPTLHITGDRDLVTGIPGAAEAAAASPNSIVLPGCGHWTQQERPQEVNTALLEFLRLVEKEEHSS
jgi:pimeloyl-ACP methyl ester carboxylesterase